MNAKNIFGAFMMAVALFFMWPAVIGSWQEMTALRSALAERQQLSEQRTEILAKAAKAQVSYQALLASATGRNFGALVPVKKDTAELVSAIQDIASDAGVQVSQVKLSEDTAIESAPYRTLTLAVDISGSYTGLRVFLSGLERYVRILNVNEIKISLDQQTGQLKYTVTADAYFLK